MDNLQQTRSSFSSSTTALKTPPPPIVISWTGQAKSVLLAGSFNEWKGYPMEKCLDNIDDEISHYHSTWRKEIRLTNPCEELEFKFIVDGIWCYDPTQPIKFDPQGNINNVYRLTPPPYLPSTIISPHSRSDLIQESLEGSLTHSPVESPDSSIRHSPIFDSPISSTAQPPLRFKQRTGGGQGVEEGVVLVGQKTTPTPFSSQLLPKAIFKELPKAELHCHLDGAVRVSTIIELAKEQNVELPSYDSEELSKLVTVTENCASLEEYLVGFDITLKVLQKPYAITRAMYEVAEDAVSDGIRYLEVRFSPILHTREGLTLSGVMEAISEGQVLAEYNFPIKVSVIVCGMRQLSSDITKDLAEIAWRYRHKGVSGFDLAGPEHGFSSKYHRKAFAIVRRKCINCTLHSGEGAGWESVQDSIQFCGAHRLGHGVRLAENPELVKFVVDHGIAVEVCITSNLHTKAIRSIRDHPIKSYFDQGVRVVICTDNPTVSGVTLSGEYALIQSTYQFTIEEMIRMIDYGFSVGFMEITFKNRMRAQVLRECLAILKKHRYNIQSILDNKVYYDLLGANLSDFQDNKPRLRIECFKQEPPITRELCQILPKTDLHVTFDASSDFDFLFKELSYPDKKKYLKETHHVQFDTKEDVIRYIQNEKHTAESLLLAKRILKLVLQTREQIERCLEIIFEKAVQDTVKYMEIAFRPTTHNRESLTAEEALEALLKHLKHLNRQYEGKTHAGVVVYVSTTADDPIVFLETAKLAVKYKHKGVCGFGVYGGEELDFPSPLTYFLSSFHYLKANNMNVSMIAGMKGVNSIISAISEGGARRISGAFSIHKFPRLMNFVANHSVPIEISLSERLKDCTKEVESFGANPVRLLLDNHVPVVICSFRGMTSAWDRSETLYQTIQQCKLDAAMTMNLLSAGFRFNGQSLAFRQQIYSSFKQDAEQIFQSGGEHVNIYKNHHYFPKIQ